MISHFTMSLVVALEIIVPFSFILKVEKAQHGLTVLAILQDVSLFANLNNNVSKSLKTTYLAINYHYDA